MRKTADVRKEFLEVLSEVLDSTLERHGFSRKQGSVDYSRISKAAVQQIHLRMEVFPPYQPGVEAHILPSLQIRMPAVSERALALVRGNTLLLADAPEIIVNQPIDFTAPKEAHERWFASGKEEFVVACKAIGVFLERWVFPFLSQLSTPSDLVALYETNDSRVLKQRHWHIFIAAACQELGDVEKAREIIRREFRGVGLRKIYAPVFESLQIA